MIQDCLNQLMKIFHKRIIFLLKIVNQVSTSEDKEEYLITITFQGNQFNPTKF